MAQDFDPIGIEDDNESPFIRISRSNGREATFSDNLTTAPAPRSRVRRVRPIEDPEANFAAGSEAVDYPVEAPRQRRTRGERPMPKRLTEEQFEAEIPAVVERPQPKSRSRQKASEKKQAEQIALNLREENRTDGTVKQRQVLGVLLIMFAVLVTLSIVSYTPQDAAPAETHFSDLPAIFTRTDPIVNAHADTAQNWLGLIGAMLADFLINKTIGYAAIIYPIFFGWWSLALFKFTTRQRRRLTLATTFFLITAVLFSATIGTTQLISFFYHLPREWSGAVGQFMGVTFTRLIGAVGALIVYFTAFLITLVFSIDLDIEKSFLRVKGYYNALVTTLRRRLVEFQEQREVRREARIERERAEELEDQLATELEPEVSEIETSEEEEPAPPIATQSRVPQAPVPTATRATRRQETAQPPEESQSKMPRTPEPSLGGIL